MTIRNIHLRWSSHMRNINHGVESLRLSESFSDVTLVCDGKFYNAHKFLLSICSDYFASIFEKTDCKRPVIVLHSIKSQEIEALLDYMYIGNVTVSTSSVSRILKIAEELKIKDLSKVSKSIGSDKENEFYSSSRDEDDIEILCTKSSDINTVSPLAPSNSDKGCSTLSRFLGRNSSITVSSLIPVNAKLISSNSVSINPSVSVSRSASSEENNLKLKASNKKNQNLEPSRLTNSYNVLGSDSDCHEVTDIEEGTEVRHANFDEPTSPLNHAILEVDPDYHTVFGSGTSARSKTKRIVSNNTLGLRTVRKSAKTSLLSADFLLDEDLVGCDEVYIYSCSMCNFGTDQKNKLRNHLMSHRKKKEKSLVLQKNAGRFLYTCHSCSHRTNSAIIYWNHVKRHDLSKISLPSNEIRMQLSEVIGVPVPAALEVMS